MKLPRHAGNPILAPDDRPWRNVVTFAPGAIAERAAAVSAQPPYLPAPA